MSFIGDFSTLPVIIDAPGLYMTRDGRRVRIDRIDQRPEFLARGFAAKGSIERMFRGKMKFHDYNIWHVSGHAGALREHPRDIVAKAE